MPPRHRNSTTPEVSATLEYPRRGVELVFLHGLGAVGVDGARRVDVAVVSRAARSSTEQTPTTRPIGRSITPCSGIAAASIHRCPPVSSGSPTTSDALDIRTVPVRDAVFAVANPDGPRRRTELAAVAQSRCKAVHCQQNSALDPLVVVTGTETPEHLHLHLVQRLQIREPVVHRALERRVVLQQT